MAITFLRAWQNKSERLPSLLHMRLNPTTHLTPILRKTLVPPACLCALILSLLVDLRGAEDAGIPVNLALHQPATCSSAENDEHGAAQANDGDEATCWRADDEPENGAEWWQVDLKKGADLSGCQICWPYEDKAYQCKVEGSADGKKWELLSDQSKNRAKVQIQDVKFVNARQIRYVKVTVTGFEEGCWASISEVKIFGR